jgi:hypothetical protein
MSKLLCAFMLLTIITISDALAEYEVPPSSATSSTNVPYISDEAMKQCVLLYNQAKWLSNEIGDTRVNRYSQASIDAYNGEITRHRNMLDSFNRDCAGKQSESAYKAAQELNSSRP